MALNLNETATLTLRGEFSQVDKEMDDLNKRAKELKQTLKEIEKDGGKGSENWKAYKQELKDVQDQTAKLRKEVDITQLSYGQLQNHVKQLNAELKGLKPGTDEFVNATKRLQDAQTHFQNIQKQVKGIQDGAEDLGQPGRWQKIASGVQIMASAFQAFMALQVVGFIVQGFTAIMGKFREFESAAQDLSAVTGLTGKDLEYLKNQAKATGPQFGMTATEMLQAYKLMGSAKPELLAQKEALADITKEAIILAKAGKMDLTDAAKATAESLNQFGKGADQARRFVNVLAAGAKEGSAEITDMSSSLKASGTVSASAKLSFEQTNAVLQSMSTIALKGEQSGTMLRNVLLKLQAGSKDTNPEIVGLDKALENLAKKNLTTAEMTKLFGTENVIAAKHIVGHRQEITELTKKLTGTQEAYGQAEKNMNTLNETVQRASAIAGNYAISLGEKLAPYLKLAIEFLIKLAAESEPVVAVFRDLFDVVGDVIGVWWEMIKSIFPAGMSGGKALGLVMNAIGLVLRALLTPIQVVIGAMTAMYQAMTGIIQAGQALTKVLSGDFAGAAKDFEASKQSFQNVGTIAKQSFDKIKQGWQEAFVDHPKKVTPEILNTAGDTENKRQDTISGAHSKGLEKRDKEEEKARKKQLEEEQKHLKEVAKANEDALKKLADLQEETHINSIKDEQSREIAKLGAKRDREVEAIMKSLADENLKRQQIEGIDRKFQQDLDKLSDDYREKKKKKDEEAAQKKLENEKFVLEQERQANDALLDWKELTFRNNAIKLAAVHKERSDSELRFTLEKLRLEEEAEKAKASREITDEEQLGKTLTAIEGKYHNEQLNAEAKHAAEVERINKELQEKKNQQWKDASNAFGALLKGDLSTFVDYAAKIVQGEQQAWQKRLAENQEKYAAVGQMAQQAAQFLADVEKRKADKAIAEAQRERDEKVKILNDQLTTEKAAIDLAEEAKKQVKEQYSDKVKSIKEQEGKKVSDLEKFYSDVSNAQGQADLTAETTRARQEADEKINQAKKTRDESVSAAKSEMTEKINAAEVTRDAEIAAIQRRADIDTQTKNRLIAESKQKSDLEIKLAQDEAQTKIKLSQEEADSSIKSANEETDKKIELMKQLQTADKAKAEQLIQQAKDEADQKVKTAEEEKQKKIKLLEKEKQERVQLKKDLERQIATEEEKARTREAEAKHKAWKAQQKADIASALIAGALATLKALASGMFPVNLVFAAVTAGMTAIQIAKIKSQPEPSFALGGVVKGSRHGSRYGESGMAIIDRQTGRETGEMEGDEAIISRDQTKANWPLIQQMFKNARTPGKRDRPVSTTDRPPIAFRDGGMFESPYWKREMYLFGSKKAKKAAAEAQEEARQAQAEAEEASAGAGDYGGDYDSGDYGGGGDGMVEGSGLAQSELGAAKKQGEAQIKLLEEIRDGQKELAQSMDVALDRISTNISGSVNRMGLQVGMLQGSIRETTSAVRELKGAVDGTTGAVYATNAQGAIYELIGAISSFGGK